MKCKPYSEITVEIRTQLKTVKITSNIFAVYFINPAPGHLIYHVIFMIATFSGLKFGLMCICPRAAVSVLFFILKEFMLNLSLLP